MSDTRFVIFLVDDDPGVLKALTRMLSTHGHEVRAFSSSTEFLAQHDRSIPGCAIFDVSMPDLDGIELQAALKVGGVERPVIFITGVGDIPVTVQAMKAGAVDFLTKPYRNQDVLDAVYLALEQDEMRREKEQSSSSLRERFESLSAREKDVVTRVAAGEHNKQIAAELGLSEVTVKVHRANALRKMRAKSLAELIRMTDLLRAC